jgi:hypothetical protein
VVPWSRVKIKSFAKAKNLSLFIDEAILAKKSLAQMMTVLSTLQDESGVLLPIITTSRRVGRAAPTKPTLDECRGAALTKPTLDEFSGIDKDS